MILSFIFLLISKIKNDEFFSLMILKNLKIDFFYFLRIFCLMKSFHLNMNPSDLFFCSNYDFSYFFFLKNGFFLHICFCLFDVSDPKLEKKVPIFEKLFDLAFYSIVIFFLVLFQTQINLIWNFFMQGFYLPFCRNLFFNFSFSCCYNFFVNLICFFILLILYYHYQA